jgi:hypothetical protein
MDKDHAVLDAHALHWASVYPDAPEDIRARIKEVVAASHVIAQVHLPELRLMPNGMGADTLTAIAEAGGELRHMVLLLTERVSASGCVLAAFPFAAGAIAHPVTVEHVSPSGSGAEGCIRGRTADGSDIAFFDPLFFKNAAHYQVGQSYQFALSAFAYSARPLGLRLVKGGDISVPADVLKPARAGACDDHEFRATVQHVYPMAVDGRTLFRMRVTVRRCGRSMLDVALYAARHILPEGYSPKPGDEITGRLWLQGYLVED